MKKRSLKLGLLAAALGAVLLQPGSSSAGLCVEPEVHKWFINAEPNVPCSPWGNPVKEPLREISDQINRITHGGVIVTVP